MRGELGRITECVRGGCYGSRIVSECFVAYTAKIRGIIECCSVMECVRIIMASFRRYWVMDG